MTVLRGAIPSFLNVEKIQLPKIYGINEPINPVMDRFLSRLIFSIRIFSNSR